MMPAEECVGGRSEGGGGSLQESPGKMKPDMCGEISGPTDILSCVAPTGCRGTSGASSRTKDAATPVEGAHHSVGRAARTRPESGTNMYPEGVVCVDGVTTDDSVDIPGGVAMAVTPIVVSQSSGVLHGDLPDDQGPVGSNVNHTQGDMYVTMPGSQRGTEDERNSSVAGGRKCDAHAESDDLQGETQSDDSSTISTDSLGSSVARSIDDFTRLSRTNSRASVPASAYINDAFSFLQGDQYGAYKYYDDDESASHSYNNSRHSTMPYRNGYVNGYAANGHYPRREHQAHKEPDKDTLHTPVKIALAFVFLALAAVIVAIVVLVVLFRGKTTTDKTVYVFDVSLKVNETWTPDLKDTQSLLYRTLETRAVTAADDVFRAGAFSSIYDRTIVGSMEDGSVVINLLMYFIGKEEASVDITTVRLEALLNARMPALFGLALTVTVTEGPRRLGTTTMSSVQTSTEVIELTTTVGTGFTTGLPEITTTEPVTCRPLPAENVCGKYQYSSAFYLDTAGANLLAVSAATGCYEHVERFACGAYYPKCENQKATYPCRIFCESFRDKCNFPINCDSFPNDDDPNVCLLAPGYVPPDVGPPPGNPCSSGQFRCGTDPPTCVPLSKRCDASNDCADASDEISMRANCDPVTPLDCDFGGGNLCQYQQLTDDDYNWIVATSPTSSDSTGPTYDHTTLTRSGRFLLFEASGRTLRDKARIQSTDLSLGEDHCLNFYYHMNGANMGTLRVLLVLANGREHQSWFRSNDQGSTWRRGYVSVPKETRHVIFEAIRGDGYRGDIALDDVRAVTSACPEQVCDGGDFQCTNENCQPLSAVCNGRTECGDFSDEMNCNCTEEQFQCTMGMCIHGYQRCDGTSQCPDDSDEQGCDSLCSLGRHKCPDGKCIPREWLCDSVSDCADSSDENNCPTCGADEFQCSDKSCVATSARCDGARDCPNGADEANCFSRTSAGVLEVQTPQQKWPLCGDDLTDIWDDFICSQLGEGKSQSRSLQSVSSGRYLKVKAGQGTDTSQPLLAGLQVSATCSGNKVVKLTCNPPSCGKRKITRAVTYVINGANAGPGSWPWQAAILNMGAFVCGGALIGSQHIVTAAHCLANAVGDPGDIDVLLGTINIRQPAAGGDHVLVKVKDIDLHPDFKRYYLGSDLAVLELVEAVTFTDFIQPICLPDVQDSYTASSLCFTTGWGYTTPSGPVSSQLQEAKLKLWSSDRCQQSYPFASEKMICAGYNSGFIANCLGDSGGPLMCLGPSGLWRLVGTYSFSATGCSVPNKPPVFTRTQAFSPWLHRQLACDFNCTNGRCLYDSGALCDGNDDCGDNSDETTDCAPSITCPFESPYMCGYRSVANNQWNLKQGLAQKNRGPIVDATRGDSDGGYVYADKPLSIMLAPLYSQTSPHCLTFSYQMRGSDVGRLTVFRVVVVSPNTIPIREVDATSDVSGDKTLFERAGEQPGPWNSASVDIQSGNFVIGFRATASPANPLSRPGIALDDVILRPGSCVSELACPAETFRCPGMPAVCVPKNRQCNFVVDCHGSQLDEQGCGSYEGKSYICDVEDYNSCQLEQFSGIMDQDDWAVVTSDGKTPNQPGRDATTPTVPGGHLLLLDTRGTGLGNTAVLRFFLPSPMPDNGCLTFSYIVHSTASLSVEYITGPFSLSPWSRKDTRDTSWRRVELYVAFFTQEVRLIGTFGAPGGLMTNYIALDNITFTLGQCDQPECSSQFARCNSGECIPAQLHCNQQDNCGPMGGDEPPGCACLPPLLSCDNGGKCLLPSQRCDLRIDCPDKSDETNCACDAGNFQCPNGPCIPQAMTCDGRNDCGDYADESHCDCTEDQFQCSYGSCIDQKLACNGQANCDDGSDENITTCGCPRDDEVLCPGSTDTCMHAEWQCDGFRDCPLGTDETDCDCPLAAEGPLNFRCSGSAVQCATRCDRNATCEPNGEDEAGCGSGTQRCLAPGECECGLSTNAVSFIVGGQNVPSAGRWPWACALYRWGVFHCGCTLISHRWIITSAHCFYFSGNSLAGTPSIFKVRLGSVLNVLHATDGSMSAVERIEIHADFNNIPLNQYDLAVVRLADDVTMSPRQRPVCMPADVQTFTPNSLCYITGWGKLHPDNPTGTVYLRDARVKVLTDEACGKAWPTLLDSINVTRQLCAGYEQAQIHTCGGDSGSPIMCLDHFTAKWELAGVTQGGAASCTAGDTGVSVSEPMVSARATAWIQWIQQTTNNGR